MKGILLLGIDGGATKISGWIIDVRDIGFSLTNKNVQRKYSEYIEYLGGFTPVDIHTQLKEMNNDIRLTPEEKTQGSCYINAATDVILELSKQNPDKKLLIGFGMPGLKTADKKGICALANGPRMPQFVKKVEANLRAASVDFFSIYHLGSDADYCGIGEEYDIDGSFRNVNNAYYLGGGTGVADAMKLEGKLITFDNMKPWIAKAWEMKADNGLSLERYASAGGIQYIYSLKSGISLKEINETGTYPPQILTKAVSGEQAAINTINDVAENIAKLLFERISTLYFGYEGMFEFVNKKKPVLDKEHPFKKTLLDKIVIGQRLGNLLEESKSTPILWNDILIKLKELVSKVNNREFVNHYMSSGEFNSEIIQISSLREAPVIGAGVDAYFSYKNI